VDNVNTEPVHDLHPPPKPVARAERPNIDISRYVPDMHDELRWPLSGMSHPKLEPTYPIATALAAPGVGWIDLCSIGAQNRMTSGDRDVVSYLRGWCNVIKGDVDNACRYLTPLLGSVTRGLSTAVRTDLANILVDQGDADHAEHWIAKHQIRDLETLDRLAASYVEVGSTHDAFAINRLAIDADNAPTAATRCRRLTRAIVLGPAGDMLPFEELSQLVENAKVPDAECAAQLHAVACWRDHSAQACRAYERDQGTDPRAAELVDLYFRWPDEADLNTWWRIADEAVLLTSVPGADDIAIDAFDAALRAAHDCGPGVRRSLERASAAITSPPQQARLSELLAHCAPR
jgi:hypothetical protein